MGIVINMGETAIPLGTIYYHGTSADITGGSDASYPRFYVSNQAIDGKEIIPLSSDVTTVMFFPVSGFMPFSDWSTLHGKRIDIYIECCSGDGGDSAYNAGIYGAALYRYNMSGTWIGQAGFIGAGGAYVSNFEGAHFWGTISGQSDFYTGGDSGDRLVVEFALSEPASPTAIVVGSGTISYTTFTPAFKVPPAPGTIATNAANLDEFGNPLEYDHSVYYMHFAAIPGIAPNVSSENVAVGAFPISGDSINSVTFGRKTIDGDPGLVSWDNKIEYTSNWDGDSPYYDWSNWYCITGGTMRTSALTVAVENTSEGSSVTLSYRSSGFVPLYNWNAGNWMIKTLAAGNPSTSSLLQVSLVVVDNHDDEFVFASSDSQVWYSGEDHTTYISGVGAIHVFFYNRIKINRNWTQINYSSGDTVGLYNNTSTSLVQTPWIRTATSNNFPTGTWVLHTHSYISDPVFYDHRRYYSLGFPITPSTSRALSTNPGGNIGNSFRSSTVTFGHSTSGNNPYLLIWNSGNWTIYTKDAGRPATSSLLQVFLSRKNLSGDIFVFASSDSQEWYSGQQHITYISGVTETSGYLEDVLGVTRVITQLNWASGYTGGMWQGTSASMIETPLYSLYTPNSGDIQLKADIIRTDSSGVEYSYLQTLQYSSVYSGHAALFASGLILSSGNAGDVITVRYLWTNFGTTSCELTILSDTSASEIYTPLKRKAPIHLNFG